MNLLTLYNDEVGAFLSSQLGKEAVAQFNCGVEHLNVFLQEDALDMLQGGITKPILFFNHQYELVAYAALCASATQLVRSEIDELGVNANIPTHQIPSIRLTHLAVHQSQQGLGVGKLAVQAVKDLLIQRFDDCFAYRLLVVDARNDERVIDFYEQNDFFRCLQDDKQHSNSRSRYSVEMYCDLLA